MGIKAVDLAAISPWNVLWLVEAKDYRVYERQKRIGIAEEAVLKVRDSLAMLAAASSRASNPREIEFAQKALNCQEIRIGVHVDYPSGGSHLFGVTRDQPNILGRLRTLADSIDPDPYVLGATDEAPGWIVTKVRAKSRR